ncbi:hypothetical protein GYMLUDRAFT_781406 [Collybiopsis luxurians FD-317 M1]|uniref:Nephrocystin 3-like N-terminal domain-containing protein n=1 Tax=Collybiopsis luxurians FD-317 M1 TaxID=944289 RepID=A0A0D0C2Y5_9AGAR|nr:hypothetical protein GYMLUDRAFT_781406 [Collybiopsis luxurians FD-317 M1]
MSDGTITPVDYNSVNTLEQPLNINSQSSFVSSFNQAHDFVLHYPDFHHYENSTINIQYHDWKTRDLDAIRKWLNAPDSSINFNNAFDKKTLGTGKWILEHQTFLNWKKNGQRLWIQGKVGSGKTVLS